MIWEHFIITKMDGSSYERRRRINHDYNQDNEGIDGNNNRRSLGDNDLLDHDHEYEYEYDHEYEYDREYEHDNENCIIRAFFNYLFRNVRSGNVETFPYLLLALICTFIPITIMMWSPDSSPINFLDYLLILLRTFFTHLLFYFLILPILTIIFLSTISFTFF